MVKKFNWKNFFNVKHFFRQKIKLPVKNKGQKFELFEKKLGRKLNWQKII